MHILQGGAPKCGNFWLYQILQQILSRTGHDTTSFIQQHPISQLARDWDLNYPDQYKIDVLEIMDLQHAYRISSVFRMPITDIRQYVSQTHHVWTHSPVCQRSGEVFSLFDKKVYIVRDPRDRAISAAKYYCSEYMRKYYPQPETDPQRYLAQHFDQLLHEWVWHVFDHLRLSQEYNIHICFYEDFLLHFPAALDRLLQYLELDLGPEQKAELAEAVSFSTLKTRNPKHLKKGEAGYWMDVLDPEQIGKAEAMAGPLIRYLGYPSEAGTAMTYATEPPHRDFERLKQELLESQALLYQV